MNESFAFLEMKDNEPEEWTDFLLWEKSYDHVVIGYFDGDDLIWRYRETENEIKTWPTHYCHIPEVPKL